MSSTQDPQPQTALAAAGVATPAIVPEVANPDAVGQMMSLSGLDEAYETLKFNQDEFIATLVGICRTGTPGAQLKALGLLWKINQDILKFNGRIGVTRVEKTTADGQKQTVVAHRLLERLTKEAPNAQGPTPHQVIAARHPSEDLPDADALPGEPAQGSPGEPQ